MSLRPSITNAGRRRFLYTPYPLTRAQQENFWYDTLNYFVFKITDVSKSRHIKFKPEFEMGPFKVEPLSFMASAQYSFENVESGDINLEDLRPFNDGKYYLPHYTSVGDWVYQPSFMMTFSWSLRPTNFPRFPLPPPVPQMA
jgi:hypothetical protein